MEMFLNFEQDKDIDVQVSISYGAFSVAHAKRVSTSSFKKITCVTQYPLLTGCE